MLALYIGVVDRRICAHPPPCDTEPTAQDRRTVATAGAPLWSRPMHTIGREGSKDTATRPIVTAANGRSIKGLAVDETLPTKRVTTRRLRDVNEQARDLGRRTTATPRQGG